MMFNIIILSILIIFSFSTYENYIISTSEIKNENRLNNIISSYERYYEIQGYGTISPTFPPQKELSNEEQIRNSEIFINGTNIGFEHKYKFEAKENYTLIYKFNQPLTSVAFLFYYCSEIISIDLSHFDSRYINDTRSMFEQCTSLRFINFTNFKTENVVNMKSMFNY